MGRKRDPSLLEERRSKAISLLQSGVSQSKIAMILNVSRQSVSRWVQAFRQAGMHGLEKKPKPGRTPKLTDEQKQELIRLLGKIAGHSKSLPMSSAAIADLIRDRYGIEFHKHHIPKLLRSLTSTESLPDGSEDLTQK